MSDLRGVGQHRAAPGAARRRTAPAGGKRRAEVRPRYGRIAVLAAAVTVTGIAVLGGFGLLPSGPEHASAAGKGPEPSAESHRGADSGAGSSADSRSGSASGKDAADAANEQQGGLGASTGQRTTTSSTDEVALPAGSGSGRRIVFSEAAQRVWLVDASGDVERTYLVSGSVTDNLDPGTYEVYSKSRWAVGIDDSGVMQYFVRFTQGDTGAAIGFHSIPTKDGVPLQSQRQLGTPQSHGCIRQRTADAVALWDFAPTGTTVVVTA